MRKVTILALSLFLTTAVHAAGRPINVTDLLAMDRLSEPQLSPDGRRAVYTVATPDLQANRVARNIWIVTLATAETKQLTSTGRDGGCPLVA
jgi:dipeptidyl aminopeptidase/acylaminoacyl peptidase